MEVGGQSDKICKICKIPEIPEGHVENATMLAIIGIFILALCSAGVYIVVSG